MRFGLHIACILASLSVPAIAQLIPGANEVIEAVESVHDGDTFTLARRIEPYGLKLAVRMVGIDTPEINGAKCPLEKAAGIAAGDYLRALVLRADSRVIVRGSGGKVHWDRNGGRIDGTAIAWLDGREQDLKDVMLNAGFGVPYTGEKKRVGGWCKLLRKRK